MSSSDPLFPLLAAVEEADSAERLMAATRALATALASRHGGGEQMALEVEPSGRAALSSLVRILGFNNPGAAVAAVEGLVACGPAAVPALLEGLDAHNYGARAWAVRALAGIGDVRGLTLLEQALGDDIGPSVRRAAAIGLGTLRVAHLDPAERNAIQHRALTALERAREDAEWVVRYAVATAMEKLALRLQVQDDRYDKLIDSLVSLADDTQEEVLVVRLRARLALSRLPAP